MHHVTSTAPENAPFRVLARIPASRVPIWQIVNPALSPDAKWLAQALTDGFTTNIWALSTTTREWRQITDGGERARSSPAVCPGRPTGELFWPPLQRVIPASSCWKD